MSALGLAAPRPLGRELATAALAGMSLGLLLLALIGTHGLCDLFCLHQALGAPPDTVVCAAAPQR